MPLLLHCYNKIAKITHLPRLFRELPTGYHRYQLKKKVNYNLVACKHTCKWRLYSEKYRLLAS